jgi:hypothetical protein
MVDANSGVNCCKSRTDSMAGVYDDPPMSAPGRPRCAGGDDRAGADKPRFRSTAG